MSQAMVVESAVQAIEVAIKIARECYQGRGIGGHPLDFATVTARRLNQTASQPERWSVSIDELQPSKEPSGRHFIIDRDGGAWRPRIVE